MENNELTSQKAHSSIKPHLLPKPKGTYREIAPCVKPPIAPKPKFLTEKISFENIVSIPIVTTISENDVPVDSSNTSETKTSTSSVSNEMVNGNMGLKIDKLILTDSSEEENSSEDSKESSNDSSLDLGELDEREEMGTDSDEFVSESVTSYEKEMKVNATVHNDDCMPHVPLGDPKTNKVFNIAKEIMTSERVFVDVLHLLNVEFRHFVLENNNNNIHYFSHKSTAVIPEYELNKILNYLPQLQTLNEQLLADLEARITSWEDHHKIADVIVNIGPFLKLYSCYIKEFQNQCNLLDEACNRYPLFAKAVRDFETSERCAKLTLKHYMLKPVQRIPQYRLLLEQYLNHLPEDSPDYIDTQNALHIVADVANHANDTMKFGTNAMKMLTLQERLNKMSSSGDMASGGYELMKPGRLLIKEGELMKLSRKGMQPRYLILLSDVLLYTSYTSSGSAGGLRVSCEINLESMRVEGPKAEDFKNEFSIISTVRSFTLQASSSAEHDEWMSVLQDAISDNFSRRSSFLQTDSVSSNQATSASSFGKQAPVWVPDYRVTMCQQCTANFTLTFRRHHCRACGKVVCVNCSNNRAPLQYKNFKPHRVCCACFEVLKEEFEKKTEAASELHLKRKYQTIRESFRKGGVKHHRTRIKRYVPERLKQVHGNDSGSQMCGYLKIVNRKMWRRGWFVLKDRVLYEYKAPEDVCALQGLPVLGYNVAAIDDDAPDGMDRTLTFQLIHHNQPPLWFSTDAPELTQKWINAMKEAVVL